MIRKFLSNIYFIHFLVLLGGFSLYGFIESNNPYILLGVYFSFAGAICGGLIRVVDAIKAK